MDDTELQAMAEIVLALSRVDDPTTQRILSWLNSRYANSQESHNGNAPRRGRPPQHVNTPN